MKRRWAAHSSLSFRARLGRMIAMAVGLTVALASLAAFYTTRHELFSQVDSALVSDLNSAQVVAPRSDGVPRIEIQAISNIVRLNGGFLQVITSKGQVLSNNLTDINGAAPLQPTPAQRALTSQGQTYRFDTMGYNGQPYRVITEGGLVASSLDPAINGQPVALQIARPLSEVDHTLSTMALILWLVAAGGIAVAVGVGFILVRTMLRPVEKLTAAAEHVAATQDLSARIEAQGDDELARLARSFNAMLTALAASREQQAQLISDAGHELRTPLTSLRTNFEVLMRVRDLPADDRAELVSDVEAQLEELTNLIGDLVDLARHEEKQADPIEVRLDSIVSGAVERARRRAPGLTFDVHLTAGMVKASPALLERAVLNVLDNAAKWSPPGGTVEVWLQRGARWALDIHDHGPGIALADLPHVFDRFYRAETARSLPGSGLGLAIVQQVVHNHGGTVAVSVATEGGTLVHIELPIVTEEEADEPTTSDGNPYLDASATPPPPPSPGQAGQVAWSGSPPVG